jgi:hypothetical protein
MVPIWWVVIATVVIVIAWYVGAALLSRRNPL